MILEGRAHKYQDNIDTDQIIPARYLNTTDPVELARHCLEDLDKNFVAKVVKNDILVAGENFGCGSSREHAPLAIKAVGISCIIAKSFARIFYRNAINIGLPILESRQAAEKIEDKDILRINLEKGVIENLTKKEKYFAQPFPPFMQEIIKKGGLLNKIKEKLNG